MPKFKNGVQRGPPKSKSEEPRSLPSDVWWKQSNAFTLYICYNMLSRWKSPGFIESLASWKSDLHFQIKFFLSQCRKIQHSLIRGVLIQSFPAGAKNFTNYVFCHPQFSGVTQNIENLCAILTPVCLCQLLSK